MRVVAKFSMTATALSRIAAQHANRSRIVSAVIGAGRAMLQSLAHVLHLLFLEVTGFLFLAIAVIGAGALVREYQKFALGQAGPGRVFLAAVLTLTFGWFGASSFWRARRKARRQTP